MTAFAIEADNIHVRFGDYWALTEVSFAIPDGAFVAVLGPNGAGKSTLLKTCLGLIRPQSGLMRLYDRPLAEFDASRMGYVPQIKTLDRSFPALAIELAASGVLSAWPWHIQGALRRQAMEALEQVGADHLASRPLARLSGGELQRVYLARALIRRPPLVLLDEPATGIDPAGERDMFRVLERYQETEKATIMMITHDWHTAVHHATHILAINRRLIGCGESSPAFAEEMLREAFGHIGHEHPHREANA
ncbi:MAG: ATP-binding cassette domain-containing protein [bacterium]|nr:ATP-binding cassette domain-containing protein [bacterium]